jgi:hypothetical protein
MPAETAVLQSLLDDANERNQTLTEQLRRRTFERDTLIARIRFSYDHGGAFISTECGDTTSTIHAPPPDDKDSQR